MSDFECACGELIAPSEGVCKKCGGRPVRMDGMSARELAAIETGEFDDDYDPDDPEEDPAIIEEE